MTDLFRVAHTSTSMRRSLWCAVFTASLAHAAVAGAQQAPRLPVPTGSYGVGRVPFDWTDQKRSNPFATGSNERRRLMAYVWYPTDQKSDDGVYLPGAKQIDTTPGFDRARAGRIWPLVVTGSITSHAQDRAPVAKGTARFPVVLFSHGNTSTSFSYTSAIEDLVSHGYVVAAVEHPYTASAVAFPDGKVIVYADRQTLNRDRPSDVPYFEGVEIAMREMRQLNEIQAADLRFAREQLARLDESDSSPFAGRLDMAHVAAVGHPLGGMSAVRACQIDARITACANLDGGTPDGTFLRYAGARPLQQPFLYVEATPPPTFTDEQLTDRGITRVEWTANANGVAQTQERQLRESQGGGYKVQLRASGMNHGSFGDAVLSATTAEAEQRARHNLLLTIEVTRAFLDKYLKSSKETLLDRGTPGNQEVTISRYGAPSY